ncbi:MAG: HAD family hydrolase [Saezia sp.]
MNTEDTIKAVFFDLDGTLIDSAPDLAGTANQMLLKRGLPAIEIKKYSPLAGLGPRGMLRLAFGVMPEDEGFAELQNEFFDLYEQCMTDLTRPYAEVPAVLHALEEKGVALGVITNKLERFAFPMVEHIFSEFHIKTTIAANTLAFKKPHKEPALESARRVGLPTERCLMVGDDLRDITCGGSAGMRTAAVTWGYQAVGFDYKSLNADFIIDRPSEILNLLK